MLGAPKVRSTNVAEPEARPVLVPGGNKARLWPPARKPALKPLRKVEKSEVGAADVAEEKEKASSPSLVVAKSEKSEVGAADVAEEKEKASSPSLVVAKLEKSEVGAADVAEEKEKASSPSLVVAKSEKSEVGAADVTEEKEKASSPSPVVAKLPTRSSASVLKRHEFLVRSNLSLNASCSSDASTESFCSWASTGRIGRTSFARRPRPRISKPDKIGVKLEKGIAMPTDELLQGKRRCAWVTSNTDPCYAVFHDEEWGVPTHDDKKLFELLVLSGALAELTWPAILSKRHVFREVFMDFDPVTVSKFNEKKVIAPGSTASSLLSEPRLRSIIDNARHILKIIEEFGSFDKYCWSFVNNKPILSRIRHPHQVPVKTPKADTISKDLMKRGFRSVSPTVIYSFMQASGITNDHLTSCYRFDECVALLADGNDKNMRKVDHKVEDKIISSEEKCEIVLKISTDADRLNVL